MKHNWEYKKFGDLCDIVRGGSPRPIQDYLTSDQDGLNWIKIGDVSPGEKYIISTKEKIKKEGLKKTREVHKGDFILSNSMSFGRPYILKIDGCIHDGWLAIKNVESHFIPDFLYYYLSSPSTYLLFVKLVRGGVVNNLNSDIVRGIPVPVPPREVQERIVGELDAISEGIAELQDQVQDLDSLAKTLFYETFGDPISNPKAWPVKKLDEIIAPKKEILRASKMISADEIIIYIDISSIDRHNNQIHNASKLIFKDAPSRAQQLIRNNDILISLVRPNLKNIAINPYKIGNIVASSGFCVVRHNNFSNEYYLFYSLLSDSLTEFLCNKINGAAYPAIREDDIRNMVIPLPPLALQQQFAGQIEEIEAMKRELEAQIAEAQTLLDSRMDYWFN